MKKIERIRAHEKEIAKHYKAIERLQSKCEHKRVKKVPHGNTGNWDKNDDRYWYEIDCLDCDKHWQEDQ